MTELTIENSCVPVGDYLAKFVGVKVTNHVEYCDGLRWTFSITEGEHKGRECYRTTKTQPTSKNSCGRFLASLSGAKPSDGLTLDPDDYVGQVYNVTVTEGQSGDSTRIDSFSPTNNF